jgi:hypothetical protein
LEDVFIAAVSRELVGAAGAADGGLEAAIARDRVVGQYAPVAPTADCKPIRVRNSARDQMIDAGQQVLHLDVAPIGKYCFSKGCAAAAAAAIVDAQHDETLGRKHLRFELVAVENQGMLVLAVGAPVNPQHGRIFAPGDE